MATKYCNKTVLESDRIVLTIIFVLSLLMYCLLFFNCSFFFVLAVVRCFVLLFVTLILDFQLFQCLCVCMIRKDTRVYCSAKESLVMRASVLVFAKKFFQKAGLLMCYVKKKFLGNRPVALLEKSACDYKKSLIDTHRLATLQLLS